MSQENVEIVRRLNAVTNSGDREAMLDLFDPDVDFRDLQHAPDLPEEVLGPDALMIALTRRGHGRNGTHRRLARTPRLPTGDAPRRGREGPAPGPGRGI